MEGNIVAAIRELAYLIESGEWANARKTIDEILFRPIKDQFVSPTLNSEGEATPEQS